MANNRYYMLCACGSTCWVGKSLGDGIYAGVNQEEMHEWMWEHLMLCPDKRKQATSPEHLGPEWTQGLIFEVITEYDERAPGGYKLTPDAAQSEPQDAPT